MQSLLKSQPVKHALWIEAAATVMMTTYLDSSSHQGRSSTASLDAACELDKAVYTHPHKPSSRCSRTRHTASPTLSRPDTTCHMFQLSHMENLLYEKHA